MLFTIKEGNHYSDQFFYKASNFFNTKNYIEFLVTFNVSCKYILPREDQEDINKLFGFSLGFNHHKNSGRFGWFYKEDKIHLCSYVYIKGKRYSAVISKLEINKPYLLSIFYLYDSWEFWATSGNDVVGVSRIDGGCKFKNGYKLWPYFGGNNLAPHDIKISLIES